MRSGKIERNTSETKVSVAVGLDGAGNAQISTASAFSTTCSTRSPATRRSTWSSPPRAISTSTRITRSRGRGHRLRSGCQRGAWRPQGNHPLWRRPCAARRSADPRRCGHFRSAFLVYEVKFPAQKIGDFDTELIREFFQAVAVHARIGLHIENLRGVNSHHIAESAFKGLRARSARRSRSIRVRKTSCLRLRAR